MTRCMAPSAAAPRAGAPHRALGGRLVAGLDAGDTHDEQLARTWIAAQDLRLTSHCPDQARARPRTVSMADLLRDSEIPELIRLAATIKVDGFNGSVGEAAGGEVGQQFAARSFLIKNQENRHVDWILSASHRSEDGYHAQWRRAGFRRLVYVFSRHRL